MAVASFDAQFSFQQDALARLGDRGKDGPLTDEQRKKIAESPAMVAARRVDEMTKQFTNERDFERAASDPFFKAEDSDFTASKAYDYKRMVNYYDILGLGEHAPLEEVKNAYKKLSLIYHPDKTKGMTPEEQADHGTIFISVKNAHLVLADKATRRQYDRDRDFDRASAEVNGRQKDEQEGLDLSEVLARIKENQKPPGKLIDVPLKCKLEKLFYSGRKDYGITRSVKDFYQGWITDDHKFRIHIPKGAVEPFEVTFKEQGDWHTDTKPDTIKFSITAKPHGAVERRGGDLVLKESVCLPADALEEPFITAEAPSLRGRHVLLWGLNPFRNAEGAGSAELRVRVQGEGLASDGFFRFAVQLGVAGASPKVPVFTRETARAFLKELIGAHKDWQQRAGAKTASDLCDALLKVLPKHGCRATVGGLQRGIATALREVEGEWGLAAAVAALLAEGEGRRPSLAAFLGRHGLAPSGGLEAPGSDDEADAEARRAPGPRPPRAAGAAGGVAARRAAAGRKQHLESELELAPLGRPVSLFTQPTCSLTFFTNTEPVDAPPGRLPPGSVFAVGIASTACARKKFDSQWVALKEQLLPLLRLSAFRVLQASRTILPQPIAEFPILRGSSLSAEEQEGDGGGFDLGRMAEAFGRRHAALERRAALSAHLPAPLKRLGDEAFRRGHYFIAMSSYTACLDAAPEEGGDSEAVATVLSNRAACLAKVGLVDDSLADAKRALELRPTWGRAWGRVGFATSCLGDERQGEAMEAWLKAVELDPSRPNVEALEAVARKARSPDAEAADKERQTANEAMGAKQWGLAIAHYTLAAALLPPAEGEAGSKAWAVLHSNRAGAFCQLQNWEAAVADARVAVTTKLDWAKAHSRLGTALLGAGQVEKAYVEFSWALMIDVGSAVARTGQQACISQLGLWQSSPARRRFQDRFGLDLGRPKDSTRVFTFSDLDFAKKPNEDWVHSIDDFDFQEDVLIVAGNLADTHFTVARALKTLKAKFRRVFYVPGNHDLWLNPSEVRTARFPDSLAKMLALLETCDDLGVDVFPAAISQDVFVVPLFSWYNAQFDHKSRPDPDLNVDEACVWSLDPLQQVWQYMLHLNKVSLERAYRGTVITFSHFVPLSNLPYSKDGGPRVAQAMGCEDLEDQIRMVRSSAHVYGHSTVPTTEEHGKVLFTNNCHGYDAALPGTDPRPLCIFSGGEFTVKDERRKQGNDP